MNQCEHQSHLIETTAPRHGLLISWLEARQTRFLLFMHISLTAKIREFANSATLSTQRTCSFKLIRDC